jgi:hypothetical protein
MELIVILLRPINSLYTVNVNDILIVVVLRRKQNEEVIQKTQQDAFLKDHVAITFVIHKA